MTPSLVKFGFRIVGLEAPTRHDKGIFCAVHMHGLDLVKWLLQLKGPEFSGVRHASTLHRCDVRGEGLRVHAHASLAGRRSSGLGLGLRVSFSRPGDDTGCTNISDFVLPASVGHVDDNQPKLTSGTVRMYAEDTARDVAVMRRSY